MASLDFFRNTHITEPDYFDEGPAVMDTVPILLSGTFLNSGGIDTTAIDPFTQGVEITQLKRFDAGLVKISAGEPGHFLRRNRFGMGDIPPRSDAFFSEIDYFNPVEYLRIQDIGSPLLLDIITFPIITSDNNQSENYIFDGIIEPLTIRAKVAFFSIDGTFEAHAIRGNVMEGNVDATGASDQVQTVYAFDTRSDPTRAFFDEYAGVVEFPELEVAALVTSGSHSATNFSFFQSTTSTQLPFVDTRYPRGVQLSTNYDVSMNAAISTMSGSTDNYVTIDEVSAPCGWTYDNVTGVGTDSLAFGGMTY